MADTERNRVLAGERISRAQIEAAGTPSAADVAAAVAACDHEQAAMLALARARRGQPPTTEEIVAIMPGIELPAIACALIAIASDRAALIELVEHKRLPQTKEASDIEALVLYGAWRDGAAAARVIPELRRLSVRQMTAESFALLATIAAGIDHPNVAAATKHIASFAKEYAKQVASDERAMTAKIDDVLATLPAEVETSRGGFTVRAAPQVGRNDPCPCGSGLKYKKCCADKPEVAPSPIPGVSWDDFLRGDKMTIDHVEQLALRDIARVDLARMEVKPLVAAYRKFSQAHEWAHAIRAIDELDGRKLDEAWADDCRDELVHRALSCGDLALAREHAAKLPRELAKLYDLDFAVADGDAAAWQALVRTAREVIASDDKLADVDLAYTLLRAQPVLGILAARACIGTARFDDPDTLLDSVEDARDRLNLPPTDPAWSVLDELTEKAKKPQTNADAEQLRATLGESSARIGELERALAAMRGELDAARTRPAAELARTPEAQPTGLEAKVRELEALIREGNAERRDLKQQLQAAAPARPRPDEGHRARRTEADDEDVGDALPLGARGVVIPRFERRVTDALAEVPAAVAAEAMRTIGTLAAGDGFAWRGVKQAKDMTRQVLMARVGIHHRLLFRVEDGALEALDLITREQLMTTLKRLRGQR